MMGLAALSAGCSSDDEPVAEVADPTTPTSRPSSTARETTIPPTTERSPSSAPAVTTTAAAPESTPSTTATPEAPASVRPGDQVLVADGFESIAGSSVGLIVNQTSVVDGRHLIDLVAESDAVDLVAVFAPEHGVRGTADAGETVGDDTDAATGTPIYSLYGDTKAPTAAMLDGVDTLVFDLQDLGARYYTYASTMGLAMQAAAATDTRFVVLDRPVPAGGNAVTGPLRTADQESFIGQYPVPSQYGLTSGELALAIKGESWLTGLERLDLEVVEMEGWSRDVSWVDTELPWIPPSPGLPGLTNALSYPATVMVEATNLSYGRGTYDSFTMVGAPWVDGASVAAQLKARQLAGVTFEPVEFVPIDLDIATDPPFEGETVRGIKLTVTDPDAVDGTAVGVHVLEVFASEARAQEQPGIIARPETFDLLAGTTTVRQQLEARRPAADIVAGWQAELVQYEQVRQRYLIYP